MGAAKRKQARAFSGNLIEAWEADDCVNFAVALARLTGWLLHVDWLSPATSPDKSPPVDQMTPLRVYVGDDGDTVFDVRGTRSIFDFSERIVRPLAIERYQAGVPAGGVATRTYSEEQLHTLPLRAAQDEEKTAAATAAILANQGFFTRVPERPLPRLPAKAAARFTWGYCAIYAEALREEADLDPVALLVRRFKPSFDATARSASGYVHSFVLHPDGTAEDSWGRVDPKRIAERFGAAEWTLDRGEHQRVAADLKRNSPDEWLTLYEEAVALIRQYRTPEAGQQPAALHEQAT